MVRVIHLSAGALSVESNEGEMMYLETPEKVTDPQQQQPFFEAIELLRGNGVEVEPVFDTIHTDDGRYSTEVITMLKIPTNHVLQAAAMLGFEPETLAA